MARLTLTGALLCMMVAAAAAAPVAAATNGGGRLPRRALNGIFDVFNSNGKTANAFDKAGNKIDKAADQVVDGVHDTKKAAARAVAHQLRVAEHSRERLARTADKALDKTKASAGNAIAENVDAGKALVTKVFTKPFTTDPNVKQELKEAKKANEKFVATASKQWDRVTGAAQGAVEKNVKVAGKSVDKVVGVAQREAKQVGKDSQRAVAATGKAFKTGAKTALKP